MRHLLTLVMLAMPSGILAAAENCDDMAQQLDHTYKTMASTFAEGVADDSAPREASRQIRMLNYQIRQLIILGYMDKNKCTLAKTLRHTSDYLYSALKCANDRTKERIKSLGGTPKGDSKLPACDMSSWVRSE